MGENECLGRFTRYDVGQPICNDVGSATQVWTGSPMPSIADYIGLDTSGKPRYKPNTSCGTIPKPSPSHAERMASLKAEVDAMAEKYKPIVDKLMEEIFESSQKPIELLSEHMATEIEGACNNYLGTLSELSKSLNPSLDRLIAQLTKPTKRKKHYKPKFTL